MFLSLVATAAGASLGSSTYGEAMLRKACRAETHPILSLGDCSAVSFLQDACFGSSQQDLTDSDTLIVCANSTVDVMGNVAVKSDTSDCVDTGGDCLNPYTAGNYFFNHEHVDVSRHISGVGMAKSGVKSCSLVIGKDYKANTDYKDTVKSASGYVLKGPDSYYVMNTAGDTVVNQKMIVGSEYVCDESVLLVTTDKWKTKTISNDEGANLGWDELTLNSFGSAHSEYVPAYNEVDSAPHEYRWKYEADFNWSIDVLSSAKKGWQNICEQSKSETVAVPNPHAIDASFEHDVVAFVSYDPAKSKSAVLHISSLSGITKSNCASSADLITIPLEKEQDCHRMTAPAERKTFKISHPLSPSFEHVCAANYFVDISDDGSFVRVGMNKDRVKTDVTPSAWFSVYSIDVSGMIIASTTTTKTTAATTTQAIALEAASPAIVVVADSAGMDSSEYQATQANRHRRESSDSSEDKEESTDPGSVLVAIDDDWEQYFASHSSPAPSPTPKYQFPGYVEGLGANFVSSGDMHVVAYLNEDGDLRIREIGKDGKKCKMTCIAAKCTDDSITDSDEDHHFVVPEAMVTNAQNHVLYVRQITTNYDPKQTPPYLKAWPIDLSKAGNFVDAADGKTPCTFFVKQQYVLNFVRDEP